LGLATTKKGFRTFLNIACENAKIFNDRVEFHAIGALHNSLEKVHLPEMATLKTTPSNGLISRGEFVRQVSNLHFVCLFLEGRYYEFSPSGVLIDAVTWEKPIVASKVPVVEDLADRFGDIGYLCASATEIQSTIRGIVRDLDRSRYERQKAAMRLAKSSRSSEALASKYRGLCDDLGRV
jgi:hypothetical protein